MKKRVSGLVLSTVMIASLCMTGCGSRDLSNSSDKDIPVLETESEEQSEETVIDTQDQTEEVSEEAEDSSSVDALSEDSDEGKILPGVYYDRVIFESGDFDSKFVGVALGPDGQALLITQEYGWGTWTKDGDLTIDHCTINEQVLTLDGDNICLENGEMLSPAPTDAWPKGFDGFMEEGKIPYWMSDYMWQRRYRSYMKSVQDTGYDISVDYYDDGTVDSPFAEDIDGKPAVGYYLYDIDNDEVPELIVKFGTCTADYTGVVLTSDIDGNLVCLGAVGLGNCTLHSGPDDNAFFTQWISMGTDIIQKVSIGQKGISTEKIFEESLMGEDSIDPVEVSEIVSGSAELTEYELSDMDALTYYRN